MSDRDLIDYLEGSRLSFQLQMPVNSFVAQNDLLNVDVPAWMTRRWLLTLAGYRYSGGPITFPPSPSSSMTQNSDNATSGAGALSVQLTWGVDGVMETALVDYPTHGATMELVGGNIRVSIVVNGASTGTAPPTVGGFLAPVARSGLGPIANPTYSESPFTVLTTNFARRPIPRRAVAFRLYQVDAITTVPVGVQQEDQNGAVVETDSVALILLVTSQSPSDYILVNNRAQYLRLNNASAVATVTVGIVWLLDLG